jgi:hypothetical protein
MSCKTVVTVHFLVEVLAVFSCVAVVASAWLETLLDVIDLLPASVIKSDVSGYQFVIPESK